MIELHSVLGKLFFTLVMTCLTALPANSSVVVSQWTPKKILLAADSLNTLIEPQPKYSTHCKIHQEQDVFFSVLGMSDFVIGRIKDRAPVYKFDFVAAARKASREPGGMEAKIALFGKLALPAFQRWWRMLLQESPQSISSIGNKVSLIIASRSEHAIAVKDFAGQSNGNVAELAQFYGARLRQRPDTQYKALGIYEEGQNAVLKNPALSKAEGVPYMVGVIEAQIQHEKDRLQANKIQRVGGPISVLQIVNGTAAWAPRYQSLCPDVKH